MCLDLVRIVDKFEGGQPTVMTWAMVYDDMDNDDFGDVELPRVDDGDYDFIVDWGDGTPVQRNIFEHNFEESGKHHVTITGKFHGLSFHEKKGRERLVSIDWGSEVKLAPAQGSNFEGCNRLETFTGIPSLISVTNMSHMFKYCNRFNGGDLSNWDTSNVQNMSRMFEGCGKFNGHLKNWDTSNVTNMYRMFLGCWVFNGDLSNWDTRKVTDMSKMFWGCNEFNGDLSKWDTSNVHRDVLDVLFM